MPKGKHAAALFEVINKSKGLEAAGKRRGLMTPGWWFGGGKKAQGGAAGASGVGAAGGKAGGVTASGGAGSRPAGSGGATGAGAAGAVSRVGSGSSSVGSGGAAMAGVGGQTSAISDAAGGVSVGSGSAGGVGQGEGETKLSAGGSGGGADAPKPATISAGGSGANSSVRSVGGAGVSRAANRPVLRGIGVAPTVGSGSVGAGVGGRGSTPVGEYGGGQVTGDGEDGPAVAVDSDRGEVSFRLSFVSVGIIVVTVVVIVVVAVLAGRRIGERSAGAQPTSEQLRAGPANPDVLKAREGQGGGNGLVMDESPPAASSSTPVPVTGGGGRGAGAGTSGGPSVPRMGGNEAGVVPGASTVVAGKVSRVVGLNYVVCQSYDVTEEADARAVVELLASRGIGATIERKVTGFGNRLVVVSAEGFPPKSGEYEALRKRIDQVSAEQARADRKWRALTPMGYRWR